MYQGHHSDGSSIQRHSVGPLYPYVLGVRERQFAPGEFTRTYLVIGPGVDEYECPTVDEAVHLINTKKQISEDRRRHALSVAHNNQQWAMFQRQRNAR